MHPTRTFKMAIPKDFLGTFVAKHGENVDELLEARGTRYGC